jgi:hypothetical protein
VLPARDKQIALNLEHDSVAPSDLEFFKQDPPVERASGEGPLNVKVMINFAPQKARSPSMQPVDKSALTSILRSIGRDPRIGKFSLVVFNMQDQKVLYRHDGGDCIDFPSIGTAIEEIKLGTVSAKALQTKNSETEFLSELLQKEIGDAAGGAGPYDALIFAGPKVLLDENVPQEALRSVGPVGFPVFYLNYNLYPQQIPWRDSIGHAVKYFRGVEYTISRPRDLWFAVSEMVEKIGKARQARRAGVPAQ